ncbi:MAG: aldo/keto reductase [Spirochaetaceae bacterium]|jgi:predicted aldo/keto reductase-like oxidoreductase|nr:aldo/keto reductase [Spirochaetaceae bacterium]
MQIRDYGKTGKKVSLFGMGCMRLPVVLPPPGSPPPAPPPAGGPPPMPPVDREKAFELIRYAADHGVTYFDTAFGYHGGESESITGEALAEGGRREKVMIATKQPFREMKDQATLRKNLENTLKKLRTGYLDVYLIHGIGKDEWPAIKERKIPEEFERFKNEGLIRAVAFSFHGDFGTFKDVLGYYDWDMCQVQQNFLDVDREATEEGIRLAGQKGCALVIMEGLRGGALAKAPPQVQTLYDAFPVKRSPVEWAFRHLVNYPEVSVILSGVSTMEQLKDDIELFSKPDFTPGCLSAGEKALLGQAKDVYMSLTKVPCTGCEYCLPCPNNVAIPRVFSGYNDGYRFGNFQQSRMFYGFMKMQQADASRCVECNQCVEKCPQHINIPEALKEADKALSMPA